jgi:quinol monooxygenase YgiN
MILGTLRVFPPPSRRRDVLELLRSVQGPVAAEPGCLAIRIYEEEGEESAIVLVEQWESRTALESHLGSDAYRLILSAIDLSSAPPEIRFDSVAESEGMELIERIRTSGHTDGDSRLREDDTGPTATRPPGETVSKGEGPP